MPRALLGAALSAAAGGLGVARPDRLADGRRFPARGIDRGVGALGSTEP